MRSMLKRSSKLLKETRNIAATSYIQLLILYTFMVTLLYFEKIPFSVLNFELFAFILGVMGLLYINEKNDIEISQYLPIIPILFILVTRIIPYIDNRIPLGYDAGIYKYIFEIYFDALPNIANELDPWIKSGFPIGIFILGNVLYLFNINTQLLLIPLFISMEFILALSVYTLSKRFFGREVAIVALILFSVSLVQFQTFWYLYYKNVVGLILMLLGIYFYESKKYIPFILTAGVLGSIHRPTFLIFGLSFIVLVLLARRNLLRNVSIGIAILSITLFFYIETYKEAILPFLIPLAKAQIGAGTFLSFETYRRTTLAYLPFGILGFLYYTVKYKKASFLNVWFSINVLLVYFKVVFYHRFLIQLDVIMIIFAAFGLVSIIKTRKLLGTIVLLFLVLSSSWAVYKNASKAEPLISEEELYAIKFLSKTEPEAFVMSTSSKYSPWVLGYSGRKTIAPGLFSYDRWGLENWKIFWRTGNLNTTTKLLSLYEKPLYIYVGKGTPINMKKFSSECFKVFYKGDGGIIYRYVC